jgi:magnesium-transporting ATPase (P-type)
MITGDNPLTAAAIAAETQFLMVVNQLPPFTTALSLWCV